MEKNRFPALIASIMIALGAGGLVAFTSLQNAALRTKVETWADDNGLAPVVQLIELLTV